MNILKKKCVGFQILLLNSNKIYLHEIIFLCPWLASASWSWLLIGRSWWHDLWWCEDVSNQFGLSQSISQRRLSPASASNITSYQAGMERNWGNISYKNSSILLEWIPSSDAFKYKPLDVTYSLLPLTINYILYCT